MKELDEVIVPRGSSVEINILVSANSRENRITGIDTWRGRLTLDIKEKPVSGRANREVVRFFSGLFSIPKGDVKIIKGHGGRLKTLSIQAPAEQVRAVLEGYLK
jgi:uncharacterized protein (TIGR00251 family)